MKPIFFLLCIAFFMCPPLQTGNAQSQEFSPAKGVTLSLSKGDNPKLSTHQPSADSLTSQIKANLDTVARLLKARDKKQIVIRKKVYHKTIKDTVYIDTCIDKEPVIITIPVPDTSHAIPEPVQKKKWLQKLFHKKKSTNKKSPHFF